MNRVSHPVFGLLLLLGLIACGVQSVAEPSFVLTKAEYEAVFGPDSLMVNIQETIDQAFIQAMIQNELTNMEEIESQLEQLGEETDNSLVQYWLAYNRYYQAIFYLKMEDQKQCQAKAEAAVATLEKVKRKNSEDYSLLALTQSFTIQFTSGMKAGLMSRQVNKHGEKAIELDPQNLRGYYVLGSSDFYTPAEYGGGKKAEEYLKKAIALPAQSTPNPYLPSWGKDQAYQLLIRWYIQTDDKESARKVYREAIQAFPDDYMLGQLAKELI